MSSRSPVGKYLEKNIVYFRILSTEDKRKIRHQNYEMCDCVFVSRNKSE